MTVQGTPDQSKPRPVDPALPAVLLLVTGLNVGGAERVVIDLARGCQAHGHRVIVVALNDEDGLLKVFDVSGLDIRFLRMTKDVKGFIGGVRDLVRMLRDERIDLVHAHMPHAAILAAAARLCIPRLKLVHTSHNFGGISWQQRAALIASRWLRNADILLAPGQHPSINASHAVVIPNGIAIRRVDAAPDAASLDGPLLLAVGRLSEQKDFGALITAFARWRAAVPADAVRAPVRVTDDRRSRARLWIAGEGPCRSALEQQIRAAGLDDSVRLLGIRADVPALLAAASAFVMSSRWEGLPLVALEAGAAGVPVIAPPVGALPWLLADGCGWLAAPEDLPAALDACLADDGEARQRATRLHDRIVSQFTEQRFLADHLALYTQLQRAK